jgi:MFS family permease
MQEEPTGAAIILGTIGVLSFIVQPGIVQGFVTEYSLSEAAANQLAFLEMVGIAAGTILAALIGDRIPWRIQTVLALLVAATGYALSGVAGGGEGLSIARVVSGFGSGVVISISFAVVGATSRPERNLGLYLVLLLTYGALGLWALPTIFDAVGLDTVFYAWAVACALAIAFALRLPRGARREVDARVAPRTGRARASVAVIVATLVGILVYNTSVGIAWANLFLIGIDAGIGEQPIANALLICQFTAIAGAAAAVYLAERVRRLWPVVIGVLGAAAALALTLGDPGLAMFTLALVAFNTLWNFGMPFILGLAASLTPSGRLMSSAIAFQMIGLAFGPLAASALLRGAADFEPVKLVSIAAMVLSLVFLGWALLSTRRVSAGAAAH